MIIRVGKPEANYHACFAKDPTGTTGYGRNAAEAIGNLILQIAASRDPWTATENIDVRVEVTEPASEPARAAA